MFIDISNFSNITNYFPIINGAMITDLAVIYLLKVNIIKSKTLLQWYKKYEIGAFIADVLSIVIGVIIARFIYSNIFKEWSIINFLFLVICIQLLHDLLFAKLFYSIPRYNSPILDTFKDYANENGIWILLADACMMISTVLLSSLISNLETNTNIVIFIILLYTMPYFIYSL